MKNNSLLDYKGYLGTVEYSLKDNVLHGKVLGLKSLVSYEGTTIKELEEDFHEAVEDYLETCKEAGIDPEKSYKGTFNVRISPQLHKELALFSASHGKTLNSTVEEAIEHLVHQ